MSPIPMVPHLHLQNRSVSSLLLPSRSSRSISNGETTGGSKVNSSKSNKIVKSPPSSYKPRAATTPPDGKPLPPILDDPLPESLPLKRTRTAEAYDKGRDKRNRPGATWWISRFVGGRRGRDNGVSEENTKSPPDKILFYHKHEPYYGFTNFSYHPVKFEGKEYPTSEHLFQSFKFKYKPGLAEHIRTCSSKPSVAFSEARRFAPEVRSDWGSKNIEAMEITIRHKFTQHKDLRRELLNTGEAELIENSDKDAFWGCGADGNGNNELGKALVRLRAELRKK